MKKCLNLYNRASYDNKLRISKAQVAHKTGFIDFKLGNQVFFKNTIPTDGEFNSLVAQVKKNTYYKDQPIQISAAYVVSIFSRQFNLNVSNKYDTLKRSLGEKFTS